MPIQAIREPAIYTDIKVQARFYPFYFREIRGLSRSARHPHFSRDARNGWRGCEALHCAGVGS